MVHDFFAVDENPDFVVNPSKDELRYQD